MTHFVTVHAGYDTIDELAKITGNIISLSETIAIMIHTSKEKDIIKLLEESKSSRHHKEFTGKGTKTFKVYKEMRMQLNHLRLKHSTSMILEVLLKTYNKKSFKKLKQIKEMGRV